MTTRTRLAGTGLILVAAVAAAGCSSKAEDVTEGRRPVAVETFQVAGGTIEESIEVVGVLFPKFEADVRAEHPGTVAEIYVSEWVPVKKGTPLARLESRESEAALQAAQADALRAEAAAKRAEREYERAVKLKEAGLMTQQGLDDAQTARDAARPAAEAARALAEAAATRLGKAILRAPMDGVIAARMVSVGDLTEKDPLFRIVDNTLFDLTVTVPSSRIHAVRTGQKLTFATDAVPGRLFEGTVAFINPSAEPGSRAVKVLAEVPNPGGDLKSGLFVKGRILAGSRQVAARIPRTALLAWDVQARTADVFVVAGDTARRRSVATGAAAGELVEIPSGLAPGEVVVTRGAFDLRDGDRVAVTGTKGA